MGVVGLKSSQRLTGSNKMKVLAVLLLCGMAAAGGMGRDQKHMYKAWAGMKAMESCWGEENMKIHTINMKLAVSQCQQEDAPELNLPPFRSPYRFINTLMVSANRKEQPRWSLSTKCFKRWINTSPHNIIQTMTIMDIPTLGLMVTLGLKNWSRESP